MPNYEYKCTRCQKEIELIQKINDPAPLCFCTKDDPVKMIKQISLSSFALKGSCWYRDGYVSKK